MRFDKWIPVNMKKHIITFQKMTADDLSLYLLWAEKEHVKNTWFLEGWF